MPDSPLGLVWPIWPVVPAVPVLSFSDSTSGPESEFCGVDMVEMSYRSQVSLSQSMEYIQSKSSNLEAYLVPTAVIGGY